MNMYEKFESNVRYYSNNYPVIFTRGYNNFIEDNKGKKYIDFFTGSGSLNYGHNNSKIKTVLLKYIKEDGICHSLDMATCAKESFIKNFHDIILKPRNMDYKFQFCGPTGTNCIEAALKLARKVTKRQNVIAFTNSFHGVTLGSLSVTGSKSHRDAGGVALHGSTFMPYENYFGQDFDTIRYIDRYLSDSSSGVDAPAAFIIETIQAEGGINVASQEWLKSISKLARKHGALLIVDDIQVGCGRTGNFFSFENFAFTPDLICLSKALSAYGLPLSLLLIKPEYDVWSPGEHNGTFRGNNLAFVTASEGIKFWQDKNFKISIDKNIQLFDKLLLNKFSDISDITLKGRGMIRGIEFNDIDMAMKILSACFSKGLIVETCGAEDQVIKLLPPLNIDDKILEQGINILHTSIKKALMQ